MKNFRVWSVFKVRGSTWKFLGSKVNTAYHRPQGKQEREHEFEILLSASVGVKTVPREGAKAPPSNGNPAGNGHI